MPWPVVLAVAYLAGAVPFSFVVARAVRGVDLRDVETGTVSGTSLYRVAGFGPLVVAGILDVAKGGVGPWLAGDPVVVAMAAGLAVVGHNWSPFLGGAGGRGISPAMGALAVAAWPGAVVLLAGLALGKVAGHTGFGSFVAQVALVPILAVVGGTDAALAGACVLVPLWLKRLAGNEPVDADRSVGRTLASRLLFDHDDAFDGAAR